LYARNREVGNLKLDLDRYPTVFLALLALNSWESKLCSHKEFFAACELFNAPDHRVGVGNVLDSADVSLKDR